ncbi:hypothetical protein [Streptomyces sp. NPDC016845]|uniref:hypothetical protein n=1 Tax=Streptomyces sp. NPDC016845 TaxID=3364972 RepID=UPI003793242C
MEWRPVVARTNRCISAVVTLAAAGVLAGVAGAAPAQAADVLGRTPQASTQDFTWPTPPSGRPGPGGIPDFRDVRSTLASASDFTWPIEGSRTPGDFVRPTGPQNSPDDFVWPAPPAKP